MMSGRTHRTVQIVLRLCRPTRVRRYDPVKNEWKEIASLVKVRPQKPIHEGGRTFVARSLWTLRFFAYSMLRLVGGSTPTTWFALCVAVQ